MPVVKLRSLSMVRK